MLLGLLVIAILAAWSFGQLFIGAAPRSGSIATPHLTLTDLSDPSRTLLQSVVGDGTVMSVYDPVGSPAGFYQVESSE